MSCPRELRQVLLKKVRQWRYRDQEIWSRRTSKVRRMILGKIRVLRTSQGIKNCFQSNVSPSSRKLKRNINQHPTMYSQERQQDDTQSSRPRKLGRRGESASSDSSRQLERGEDIQIGKNKVGIPHLQISDHRYLEKIFKNVRKKLNLAEVAPALGVEALKTNVLIWGLLKSTTTKAAVHLGPNYVENLEFFRITNFEELQNFYRYHAEIDI